MTAPALETIKQQATLLASKHMPKGFKAEALHIYKEALGNPLFARLRARNPKTNEKWIRPLSWETGDFTLKEPAFLERKPLYGLERIASRPTEPLIVCEGEWCADQLDKFGVLATTSGGATSAIKADWDPLKGRQILIWPDNDAPGHQYGEEVRKELVRRGCMIEVLAVAKLGLSKGGDAVDWLKLNANATAKDMWSLPRAVSQDLSKMGEADAGYACASEKNKETADSYAYDDGHFELSDEGLHFVRPGKKGPILIWICSPLRVEAMTRDGNSSEWGYRVCVWDADDVEHPVYLSAEALFGDGSDVLKELARCGLRAATNRNARDLLLAYIGNHPTKIRVRTVDQVGWDRSMYVTHAGAIGAVDETVVCRTKGESVFSNNGTIDDWKDAVAGFAVRNTRLAFAISVAFAAPLIEIVGLESGGVHLLGPSSCGKTTLLRAAASVYGEPGEYIKQWRTTTNGLEGLAASHNDGLLILDELSQADPLQVGEAAYMLANGRGKTRATRTGESRPPKTWRIFTLSSGEESLAALMATVGKRANAGQEIRLADVEVDAGLGMGVFENLHGLSSSSQLAEALNAGARGFYGTVGFEWLRHVVDRRKEVKTFIDGNIGDFVDEVLPGTTGGLQSRRIATRFGLIAVAGELATEFGLTGWSRGDSEKAAKACFRAWLDAFGDTGTREDRALLRYLRSYFEQYSASRFQDIDAPPDSRMPKRVGFYRQDASGARQFLVPAATFASELCSGFDARAAANTLLKRGWIAGKRDRSTHLRRLPGMGQTRTYIFTDKLFEAEL